MRTQSRTNGSTRREEQFILSIELNLRTLLFGHNGVPIRNSNELCFALAVIAHALSKILVNPELAVELIPGAGSRQWSYWSRIELALDVADPGRDILGAMNSSRSPRIRKNATFYPNSVYLQGTNATIKAYDKVAQMMDKHDVARRDVIADDEPLTRLEIVLEREKLVDFDMLANSADWPKRMQIAGKSRLVSFTLEKLARWHRSYFSELHAVFYAEASEGATRRENYAAVLAAVAHKGKVSPNEVRDAIVKYGNMSKTTADRFRVEVEDFSAARSELKAEKILSEKAYRNPPILAVEGRKGCDFYLRYYGSSQMFQFEQPIRRAYCDKDSGIFTPKQDLMYFRPGA
ncbi:MAG: hypothetical protein ACSHYB_08510 [Roseibacillus sp.]